MHVNLIIINSNIITGSPTELFVGDDITITIKCADVGLEIESFKLTSLETANYSLAEKDIVGDIVNATIGDNYMVNNANNYTKPFKVDAEIPKPQTTYVEVCTVNIGGNKVFINPTPNKPITIKYGYFVMK